MDVQTNVVLTSKTQSRTYIYKTILSILEYKDGLAGFFLLAWKYVTQHLRMPIWFIGVCCSFRPMIRPPLLSSGLSAWLQIQRPTFDSRRYQIFGEVVVLERGPFSLVSTTEELLERKSSGSVIENLYYGRRDPSRWSRGTLYQQKLALTSPTRGDRSVGIVDRGLRSLSFLECGRWQPHRHLWADYLDSRQCGILNASQSWLRYICKAIRK
jgi:hypothetical protein